VAPEHVGWVSTLMTTLLEGAKLDRFVAAQHQRLHGGEEAEIRAALQWLTTAMHASTIFKAIVQEVYWYQEVARVNEVAETLACDRKSARIHLYKLANQGLLRDTPRGWQRTPLFATALKRLREEASEEDEIF
jgi:hypothetical protein